MEQLVILVTKMRKKMHLLLLLFMVCCSNSDKKVNSYSISIHYQYVVFKSNAGKSFDVYVENFLNIKNNSNDTLVIPFKNVEENLRMTYKNHTPKSFIFMSKNDIKIAPLDSIDLNCAVNLHDAIEKIPEKIHKKDYRVINSLSKEYLPYSIDYEIIRTTKFGVFKEEYLK